MLYYVDHKGKRHEMIGVPAERYLGNEDARGGYGALQYEIVMGQVYDRMCATGTYDPDHPPFFVLHSDGDNHGGGAESYYTCNTARLVEMCRNDRRFQLITIKSGFRTPIVIFENFLLACYWCDCFKVANVLTRTY
jgi:hypothetical protein